MSNHDLVTYIVEQASQAGEVNAKKMFGDYCLVACKNSSGLFAG